MSTETTTLDAGRELDALVAERVMGWRVNRRERGGWTVYDADGKPVPPTSYFGYNQLPEFSTDIRAAWLVVENLRVRGMEVVLGASASSGPYFCEVAAPRDRGSDVDYAETAPLAICRATLAATSPQPETSPDEH